MQNLSSILLKATDSLEVVIYTLQKGGLRIVMVVDDDSKLLGIITDGDLRRALLEHNDMNTKASEIMNSKPFVASEKESKEFILEKMRKENILAVPILDSKGIVKSLETIHEMIKRPFIDNPVILMAGGYGKRLRPLTEETPKPLLKIGSEPILETIIKRLSDFGLHNYYISTHYKSDKIKDYFEDGSKWGVNIDYIDEKDPMGTAGALTLLPPNFSNLPVIVMNGDLVTDLNFHSLLENHDQSESDITVCVVEYDFQVPYGVVEVKKSKVKKIIEKPKHKFFVNAGVYIINPGVIDTLPDSNFMEMTDFLQERTDIKDGINIFPIFEKWLDIGRISEYKKVNNEKS
tara:strand:+ start:350 stop:1390 length:1041 start_codon:yes stop_codon:yes gene_type:complete